MKPRYAIVNEYERDNFEKEWQMPYGYGKCFVSTDPQAAVKQLEKYAAIHGDITTFIVEKISDEGRELYYRI
jgi:hypothetical protein